MRTAFLIAKSNLEKSSTKNLCETPPPPPDGISKWCLGCVNGPHVEEQVTGSGDLCAFGQGYDGP